MLAILEISHENVCCKNIEKLKRVTLSSNINLILSYILYLLFQYIYKIYKDLLLYMYNKKNTTSPYYIFKIKQSNKYLKRVAPYIKK